MFAGSVLASLGWINLQSYALAEAESEGDPGSMPGLRLRSLAIATGCFLIGFAALKYPAQDRQWLAMLLVALVQISLTRIPIRFIHPIGEWSLAALGLLVLIG